MCPRTKQTCACLILELYSSAPLERYVVLAFCMQRGGGLYVWNGGTANLDGCNVFDNEATVGARLLNLQGPYLQHPAGTLHVLASCFLAGRRGAVRFRHGDVDHLQAVGQHSPRRCKSQSLPRRWQHHHLCAARAAWALGAGDKVRGLAQKCKLSRLGHPVQGYRSKLQAGPERQHRHMQRSNRLHLPARHFQPTYAAL